MTIAVMPFRHSRTKLFPIGGMIKKCITYLNSTWTTPELHYRDDDYPLAPETINIDIEITGEKQHQLRAKYFGATCFVSRKLVCSFFAKQKYVMHNHILRF